MNSIPLSINVATESVGTVFLIIILFSCIMRPARRKADRTFLMLVFCTICLMCLQLFCWLTDGMGLTYAEHPVLFLTNRICFVLDFSFYYLLSVLFYQFTIVLLEEQKPLVGNHRRYITGTFHALALWGVLYSLFFASSMWTGALYTIEPNGFTHYTRLYWTLLPLSLLAPGLNLILLLHNSRLLGIQTTILLAIYPILPLVLLPFDLLYNLCLSYICFPFELMIIYIGVNLQRDRQLLEQKTELALRDAEMTHMKVNLMMSQIQPHFLYNALTSISYLCTRNPEEAEKATNEFANYLRANLKAINANQPIPFDMEMQHVENYLNIQKRRFQDRLSMVYDIQVRDFSLPPLTLQTIVENAVTHGVASRMEPVTVRIDSQETETAYIITVSDDGPGFDTNLPLSSERLHIGISSAKIRLKEMVNGTLDIRSHPGKGTMVTITVPK